MARERQERQFDLENCQSITIGDLALLSAETGLSIKLHLDDCNGKPAYTLLLLTTSDYEKWQNRSLEQRKG